MKNKSLHAKFVDLPNQFSANYAESPQSPKRDLHIHDAYEMVLIMCEGIELDSNEDCYSVPYGSLLLFNTMDLHRIRYTGSESYRRWVVLFKREFLSELEPLVHKLLRCFFARSSDKPNLLLLTDAESEKIREMCEELRRIYRKRDAHMRLEKTKLSLAQFLITINDIYIKKHSLSVAENANGYSSVYEAIQYIQENVSRKITSDELARLTGIDKRTLCSSFKSITGLTTAQYFLNFRLNVAKSLLTQGMSVTEVCEKTGFENWSNFSRTFRNHVGLSPKQYAMQARRDK